MVCRIIEWDLIAYYLYLYTYYTYLCDSVPSGLITREEEQ